MWDFFKSFWFKLLLVVVVAIGVFYFLAWFEHWGSILGLVLFREGRVEEAVFVVLLVVSAWFVLRKLLFWLAKIESK